MINYRYLVVLKKVFIVTLIVLIAALLRIIWPFNLLGERLAYSTFYPAVMLSAVYGGLYLGLIATFLSSLLVYFAYLYCCIFINDFSDLLGLLIFNCNGILFSVIGEVMCRMHFRQEAALAKANRLANALDEVAAYVYIKDDHARYVYANKMTLELFQCNEQSLVGKSDSDFFPKDTVARLREIDERVLKHGESTAEEIVSFDNYGKPIYYWEVKTPLIDEKNAQKIWGLCGISTDITERKLLLNKLEEQAHQDYLTNLYNRRFFLEQGEIEFSRSIRFQMPMSMLMLDIDYFKKINDQYGHKVGDLVLQHVSHILSLTLRKTDIIARIGGEEFAIILANTNNEDAKIAAERLRETIENTALILENGFKLFYTASIGISVLKNNADDSVNTLMNDADIALYQAKRAGRNQIAF